MRCRFLLLIIFSVQFACNLFGQNLTNGARSEGMGNASVTLIDVWSIYNNQAAMAYIENPSFGASFSNQFAVKELSTKAISLVYPVNTNVFGLSFNYFGYALYNESKVGLAFAKRLGKYFSVGIQLDYFDVTLANEYGSTGVALGEIGFYAQPLKKLSIGVSIYNISRSKIANFQDERLPSLMRLGFGYHFTDMVQLTAETEKDLSNDMRFKAGVEFKLVKNIMLRTGINTNPVYNSFGISYVVKNFRADLAFQRNSILGYSTFFSMNYEFIKTKDEPMIEE